MKLKMKVLSSIILLSTMALSGCMNIDKENADKAKGVKISRTGNSVSVIAKDSFEGASIVIDEEIEAKDIKSENTNLVVVKREKDKTIVSIVKPEGEVKAGELLFAVNSAEKLSIEATEVVTTKEANEVYAKEAKKIATRATGDVLVGDFDNNQSVDVSDFVLFAKGYEASYSKTYDIAPAEKASSDSKWADIYSKSINDGAINIFDFIIFGRNFGKVNPDVSVKTVEISGDSEVSVGSTIALNAKVTYSNSTTGTLVDWKSSDESKATVVNGTVKGIATGTAVITATKEGVSQTKTITVKPAPVTQSAFSWRNALVYFVLTDRFNNGDKTNDNSYNRKNSSDIPSVATFHGGDIKGVTEKLDYLDSLGVNAIWITAPYEQIHGWVSGKNDSFPHFAFHGYYAQDWTFMDKNMGTVEEFRTFVNEAHKRGIRVVMDIVMNHTGYNTTEDMITYGFGKTTQTQHGWIAQTNGKWSANEGNDWTSSDWGNWWGSWVRGFGGKFGFAQDGFDVNSNPLKGSLSGLPDFVTEASGSYNIPKFLKTKWATEDTAAFDNWRIPAAANYRKDGVGAPADYLVKWLAAWVEEFGVDGFRCDTAKHVDLYRWKQLKDECKTSLNKWRASSKATEPAKSWKDDFWMTGEAWGQGLELGSSYHTQGGFDSTINFSFNGSQGGTGRTPTTSDWSNYANQINNSQYNVLSYVSSHDTGLCRPSDMKQLGTMLILLPGGVQIFYGDETGRPSIDGKGDTDMATRGDMNWSAVDGDVNAHWKKVGKFRKNHVAVGAGKQTDLGSDTYGRVYNDDKVVIKINGSGSVAVNVSGIFADGTAVRNAYDGTTGTVSGGKVTFTANNGVILIEKQ